MAYSNTTPASGSSLGSTRAQVVENFDTIQTAFELDHGAYDAGDQGKHNQVTMPESSSDPSTAASEGALYTKDTNSRSTLFYRQESDGTSIQMTGPDPSASASGYTFLPGGLLIQWGTVAAAGLSTNFPIAFGTVYRAIACPTSAGPGTIAVTALTNSAITVNSGVAGPYNYFAIGSIA